MTGATEMPRPRRRRRTRTSTRRRVLAVVLVIVAGLLTVGVLLAVFRYLPALDDARALRTDVERVLDRAKAAGLGMDRGDLEAIRADLDTAAARFGRLDGLLADDPLVGIARALPPTRDTIVGADSLAAAGHALLDAADTAMAIGDRFVAIKERQAASGEGASSLAGLVELMATGRDEVDRMIAEIDGADAALAAAPEQLAGPLASVRDLVAARLADYGPALRAYGELDDTLPNILGWDSPRRYLVLTQNPAELRPTGGYIGSFGVIAFDKGRITERSFQDVFLLDLPWDYPFVAAPDALRRYLLGPGQPWQLADANWSPDFPTSARQAIELYRNEDGPGEIDGVLAITTYTIDELLKVTGPITVTDSGVTIASGETTLKLMQNTRVAQNPEENRKAFLSRFADQLFGTLFALPPSRWVDLAASGDTIKAGRLLLGWFEDPAAQTAITRLGFDGAVRQDPGDYVYPVDSNVSPVSKLNGVTDRSLDLTINLDELGNARNELSVTWVNRIETPEGKAYRELPTLEDLRTLGMYFRLLVPERSRVEAVATGTTQAITAPADVGEEAGRMVIANYFRIPPGTAHLRYEWTSPYPADLGEDDVFTYRLTIQKQPGLRPGPLALRINLPAGATVLEASPGLTLAGQAATVDTIFDRDIVVVVRYRAPGQP